jgi:hypothetical protein
VGLIVAFIGTAITILWPTKRWIGWMFLAAAAGLAVWWLVQEFKMPLIVFSEKNRIVSTMLVSLCAAAVFGLIWWIFVVGGKTTNDIHPQESQAQRDAKLEENVSDWISHSATKSFVRTDVPGCMFSFDVILLTGSGVTVYRRTGTNVVTVGAQLSLSQKDSEHFSSLPQAKRRTTVAQLQMELAKLKVQSKITFPLKVNIFEEAPSDSIDRNTLVMNMSDIGRALAIVGGIIEIGFSGN